jgi:hypothetical protein
MVWAHFCRIPGQEADPKCESGEVTEGTACDQGRGAEVQFAPARQLLTTGGPGRGVTTTQG